MIRIKLFFILACMALSGITAHAQFEATQLVITDGLDKQDVKAQIEQNTSLLLIAMGKAVIEDKIPDLSGIAISPDASKTLLSMWQYTSAMVCPVSLVQRKCLQRVQGGYQIRDIPITMMDAPEKDEKQDLVINFTPEGKIDGVLIAADGITEIFSSDIKELVKTEIIKDLVENFRTAYNIKDIEYLEKIFGNEALIITGKVIKVKPNSDDVLRSLDNEKIVYITQTKAQYLTKLKTVFAVNKYISVAFDSIEVMKHPKYPEVYGVTLKQTWKSDNYGDKGYLFLMIDFRNSDPVIQIRAWQPTIYNGKELSREERFRTTSFGPLKGR